jgi:hypothetical protein
MIIKRKQTHYLCSKLTKAVEKQMSINNGKFTSVIELGRFIASLRTPMIGKSS